jgi:hypothetical protein
MNVLAHPNLFITYKHFPLGKKIVSIQNYIGGERFSTSVIRIPYKFDVINGVMQDDFTRSLKE